MCKEYLREQDCFEREKMECVPEARLSQKVMLAIIKVRCLPAQPLALFSWLFCMFQVCPVWICWCRGWCLSFRTGLRCTVGDLTVTALRPTGLCTQLHSYEQHTATHPLHLEGRRDRLCESLCFQRLLGRGQAERTCSLGDEVVKVLSFLLRCLSYKWKMF